MNALLLSAIDKDAANGCLTRRRLHTIYLFQLKFIRSLFISFPIKRIAFSIFARRLRRRWRWSLRPAREGWQRSARSRNYKKWEQKAIINTHIPIARRKYCIIRETLRRSGATTSCSIAVLPEFPSRLFTATQSHASARNIKRSIEMSKQFFIYISKLQFFPFHPSWKL